MVYTEKKRCMVNRFLKQLRTVVHSRKIIVQSLIIGLAVALITGLLASRTKEGLILFAGIAASAGMICHAPKLKSNSLRSVMLSYSVAVIVSIVMWHLTTQSPLSLSLALFIGLFFTSLLLLVFDIFHAPALTAVMGFLLYTGKLSDLIFLLVSVWVVCIGIKFLWYCASEELKVEHFVKEFTKKHYGN